MLFLNALLVLGLMIGALARLIFPGRQSLSVVATLSIAVAVILILGYLGPAISGANGRFGFWLLALAVSVASILAVEKFTAHRNHGAGST